MLIARDLSVTLGPRAILHDIALDARPGRITAIVGPNGSGKTTLLRALTGDVPATGTITLNGRDIRAAKAWDLARIRAVLPQSTPLAFPFTVIEVARLGLAARIDAGSPGRAAEALHRCGLGGYEARFYQDLSGGEQQRVQLARVLAQVWAPLLDGQPRWLFLDEPVSSLDIGHQLLVMQIARDFADAGGGVVTVMHDLNLTAMFSDAVALMAGGRLLGHGTPAEILTDALLTRAYRCPVRVNTPPASGPWLLPQAARLAAE